MVRAIKDFEVLKTLSRENTTDPTLALAYLDFADCKTEIHFRPKGGGESLINFSVHAGDSIATYSGWMLQTASTPPEKLEALMQSIPARISWRTAHDETGVPLQDFIDVLNDNASHLNGLASFPLQSGQAFYTIPQPDRLDKRVLRIETNGELSIDLNDDSMSNRISIKTLPSGWRAFGGLLAWLKGKHDEICVIEEPETHLHPTLQRLLIQRISEIAEENNLQLFLSTHSSVLIDIGIWPTPKIRLFEANGHALSELTNPALAMRGLGIRPSDIFQANGIVWVEGASDRIYLLHWLKLWCEENNREMPVENMHFSFSFYGGSMLGHYSASGAPGLIDMFSVNNNSIVVMDRDLDFVRENDVERCLNQSCVKYRVWSDFPSEERPNSFCWITEDYTIENYLPREFSEDYFTSKNGRFRKDSGYSKVAIAERFTHRYDQFQNSHRKDGDLQQNIEKIFNAVFAWNN